MLTIFTPDQVNKKETKIKHALDIFAFDIHEFNKSKDVRKLSQFFIYLKTHSGVDMPEIVYNGWDIYSKSPNYDFEFNTSLGEKFSICFEMNGSSGVYSQSIDLYYWIE